MSPKKITDTDKLEIVRLYRQAGDTTASLANRYGVSNSTISRVLKNTIPEGEYEEIMQQKRGWKIADEDAQMAIAQPKSVDSPAQTIIQTQLPLNSVAGDLEKSAAPEDTSEIASPLPASPIAMETPPVNEDLNLNSRRVRRRSSAPMGDFAQPATASTLSDGSPELEPELAIQTTLNITPAVPQPPAEGDRSAVEVVVEPFTAQSPPVPPPVSRMPVLRSNRPQRDDDDLRVAASLAPIEEIGLDEGEDEDDDDVNPDDVSVLAAMFGEEIAGDEDECDDEEDDDEEENSAENRILTTDRHLEVTPLSQATLPRTCYIVIDKFAELIVRPLKDFADLGQIPGEEIQQRTLPVFDNHRVAKRFSNQRTQRVIKVPDSKVFHKTTPHLRSKGITRLLVDGNIYSLN